MDILVPPGQEGGASPGEMVTVELTRWPTATRGAVGRVVEVLGDIDAPGVDTEIIIRKFGIPDAHSAEAVAEAVRLGGAVARARHRRPHRLPRPSPTVTIDGEHARDFDDAITIERLPNGHYWLGVHIADVSHYVQEGSALDREAYERGTSVYFPERAVHMFPSELATGLCSLNPHVDRLVQSCLMEVDRRGEVVRSEFHDGVINSDERMTYTGGERDPDRPRPGAARAVRAARADVRADARALPDPQRRAAPPRLDRLRPARGRGHHRRGRRGRGDHRARSATSRTGSSRSSCSSPTRRWRRYLEAQGAPALYRVHEEPDVLKVAKFEEFISGFGYSLARAADGAAAAALPEAARADPRQARGEADRVPDAAHDAEGALRAGEPRALRPGGVELHALHVADPPLSRPRRAPRAARGAARALDRRSEREELERGAAGDRAPHLRDGAARRRGRARAAAVEEGQVHGRQGRRRVRGLRHRRGGVRPVHRAGRALRRGAGARLDDGRRLLPVPRGRAHAARREHAEDLPARRQGAGAGRSASTWSVRQIDLGLVEILERVRGRRARAAPQQGAAEARERGRRSRSGPGRRERQQEQGPAGRRGGRPVHRRRHRRAHRSRQERARAGADRHRSGSAEGREGARHHDRPRVRPPRHRTTSTSRSSTCPGTSGSSRTCSPASAASTSSCSSSRPTSR